MQLSFTSNPDYVASLSSQGCVLDDSSELKLNLEKTEGNDGWQRNASTDGHCTAVSSTTSSSFCTGQQTMSFWQLLQEHAFTSTSETLQRIFSC